MIADQSVAGIDVSKDWLDVHVLPSEKARRFAYTPAGLAGLVGFLGEQGVTHAGLEASGGYERGAVQGLAKAGLITYLLAPARIRWLAQGLNILAKTDAIDAAVIAQCLVSARKPPRPYQPDAAREKLDEMASLRRQMLADANKYASRLDVAQDRLVHKRLALMLARIKAEIVLLDKEIRRHIQSTALKARYDTLIAINGVGPVLAATLLADLPELGSASSKQLASLVGVAPHARQSGKSQKPGRCTGGRPQVRNVLYMATLAALRSGQPALKTFYERLRTNGKPFKLAITAAMRKFIIMLNAIVKQNTVA